MSKCLIFGLMICIMFSSACRASAMYSDVGIRNVDFDSSDNAAIIKSVVFYQTSTGELVPVSIGIHRQEGMGKAAVRLLVDSAALREKLRYYDLYPVLPEGTCILGMTIRQGIAKVDFSKDILEYASKTAEKNIFDAVILTLTEFNTVDKVEILIEGKNMGKLKYGFDTTIPIGR